MSHIAVIGAGITGITTAYALSERGFAVTVFDRQRYPGMETSFANGGQLSASNAEVWNSWSTLLKGVKWMLKGDAPLLLNPRPSWHKYSWLAEFLAQIPHYQANTVETVRLAIAARTLLHGWAAAERIDFDCEERGILHIYRDRAGFDHASAVNALLTRGGLDRRPVTPDEMLGIEPNLHGRYYGGFFTPSDATGDIHKFTRGLAKACERRGVQFVQEAEVEAVTAQPGGGIAVAWHGAAAATSTETARFDGAVICAGLSSRRFAAALGDRVNIYPVKGYSITVHLDDAPSQDGAPWVSLLDDQTKIVSSRFGATRFRVAGTAEFNGENRDIRHDRIQPLVRWVRQLFPAVDTSHIVPWAGLRPMLPSMLPRVGAGSRPGVFYNTGHGHLGWTLSAATADLVAEAVMAKLPAQATSKAA
ncbi:D-amino acid dehydrogenase [Lichenihabitans sp. Uapishka_5]|uniref:D-amino acid dehydrogenase n=1 Tax=Lichenihabitans sp. Uapishka_5 TaxID=3037302 RepID=UPI0029E8045C|nr:D-amino acid dehydrogenase [Lichenihabitans sp. Uapishka_5]MDX7951644.1 D-amino acid dehydrogenase [Lichenihabitans sp. Uapishka_5]